jgi:hypothetical protein
MATSEGQPNYPPPPEREPGKNGIMIDNVEKWQAWCKATGGIPYPCEKGKPLTSLRNKGYVPVERMNNQPGTNADARIPGLPMGANNICCWRKISPP